MWSIKVNICIAFGKTRLVSVQVWMEAYQFEYVRGRTIKRNSSVMWNFVTKILSVVKTTRVTRAHFWMFSFQFFCFYPWIWQKDLTRTYYSGSKNAIIDRQTDITNHFTSNTGNVPENSMLMKLRRKLYFYPSLIKSRQRRLYYNLIALKWFFLSSLIWVFIIFFLQFIVRKITIKEREMITNCKGGVWYFF